MTTIVNLRGYNMTKLFFVPLDETKLYDCLSTSVKFTSIDLNIQIDQTITRFSKIVM